jgi:hypothetical protein
MTTKRKFTLLMTLLTAAACSTPLPPPPRKFAGAWSMELDRHTFLVVVLNEDGETITGSVRRPESFQTDAAGIHFSHINPTQIEAPIASASVDGNRIHFVTKNPKDKTDDDQFDFTLSSTDHASLKFSDSPFDPWPLSRVPGATLPTVFNNWDPGRSYTFEEAVASNPEMKKIYDADQQGRQNFLSLTPEQQSRLTKDDEERRRQTQQLLTSNQLHTAEDFRFAAFVFQHGSKPDDFLLAHTLASVAVAKGDAEALWIAAATLDRYLQSVGKPQIYGTQFKPLPHKNFTQEPYKRELISDALRRHLGVPALAAQQDQLKQFRAEAAKSK